jgi:hypothetical protein
VAGACLGIIGTLASAMFSVAASAGAGAPAPRNAAQLPPALLRPVDFQKEIRPLLEAKCLQCHGPEKQRGGFRLDSREQALRSGDGHAPNIKPGDSAASPLVHFVAGTAADLRMPEKGEPLTGEQVGLLRAWIDQGATWGPDAAGAAPTEDHWAFQPVVLPKVPRPAARTNAGVDRPGFGENPVDAFIQARLAEERLTPSREAARATLIRRLYLVMLGVPPTPEEVSAFEQDGQPQAFERLVDRVLVDSRYGERWARHWLDLIRFAESNGFETNRERLNAWRFRDYVIAAFNEDKPYDQFVREQLAGDALGSDVATGFLVGGPVDIVGSPDPVLTAQQRADELDDMVSTTGTAFLGLSLGCARCHTHKFDPITHREYYAMTALLAGVRHGDRALPVPAEKAAEIAALDRRILGLEKDLARFLPTAAPTPGAGPAATTNLALRPAVNAVRNEE